MAEPQPLSSKVPLALIKRPACPKCQVQMKLAQIMPAFQGTDLHTFECRACNHVIKTGDRAEAQANLLSGAPSPPFSSFGA